MVHEGSTRSDDTFEAFSKRRRENGSRRAYVRKEGRIDLSRLHQCQERCGKEPVTGWSTRGNARDDCLGVATAWSAPSEAVGWAPSTPPSTTALVVRSR